jgi:hypothetical protein
MRGRKFLGAMTVWLARGPSTHARSRQSACSASERSSADDPDGELRLWGSRRGCGNGIVSTAAIRIDARLPLARRFPDLALKFATHSNDVDPFGTPRIARW